MAEYYASVGGFLVRCFAYATRLTNGGPAATRNGLYDRTMGLTVDRTFRRFTLRLAELPLFATQSTPVAFLPGLPRPAGLLCS